MTLYYRYNGYNSRGVRVLSDVVLGVLSISDDFYVGSRHCAKYIVDFISTVAAVNLLHHSRVQVTILLEKSIVPLTINCMYHRITNTNAFLLVKNNYRPPLSAIRLDRRSGKRPPLSAIRLHRRSGKRLT
jgi:hypothetical protein